MKFNSSTYLTFETVPARELPGMVIVDYVAAVFFKLTYAFLKSTKDFIK